MPVTLNKTPLTPPVFLAPLAGITDLPFRDLVSSFGAGLVVSEMVASQEMVQARPGTRERAELGMGQAHTAVQLAGRDPYWMAEAARLIEDSGARDDRHQHGMPCQKGHDRLFGVGPAENARSGAFADRGRGERGVCAGHPENAAGLG